MRSLAVTARRSSENSPREGQEVGQEPHLAPLTATHGVVVHQYTCVSFDAGCHVNDREQDWRSAPLVEKEALLLQRFRAAVCTWRSA
jgi:hypothetical protein